MATSAAPALAHPTLHALHELAVRRPGLLVLTLLYGLVAAVARTPVSTGVAIALVALFLVRLHCIVNSSRRRR
jgi:hypothetical protein